MTVYTPTMNSPEKLQETSPKKKEDENENKFKVNIPILKEEYKVNIPILKEEDAELIEPLVPKEIEIKEEEMEKEDIKEEVVEKEPVHVGAAFAAVGNCAFVKFVLARSQICRLLPLVPVNSYWNDLVLCRNSSL